MTRGSAMQAALVELRKDPARSSKEIAAACGQSAEYVRTVARRHGISVGIKRVPRGITYVNRCWLEAEAKKSGSTYLDMLNAVLNDARCEAEEVA